MITIIGWFILYKYIIKSLKGITTICSQCKKIKNYDGKWISIEKYLAQQENVEFSHGYCDFCYQSVMDSLDDE